MAAPCLRRLHSQAAAAGASAVAAPGSAGLPSPPPDPPASPALSSPPFSRSARCLPQAAAPPGHPPTRGARPGWVPRRAAERGGPGRGCRGAPIRRPRAPPRSNRRDGMAAGWLHSHGGSGPRPRGGGRSSSAGAGGLWKAVPAGEGSRLRAPFPAGPEPLAAPRGRDRTASPTRPGAFPFAQRHRAGTGTGAARGGRGSRPPAAPAVRSGGERSGAAGQGPQHLPRGPAAPLLRRPCRSALPPGPPRHMPSRPAREHPRRAALADGPPARLRFFRVPPRPEKGAELPGNRPCPAPLQSGASIRLWLSGTSRLTLRCGSRSAVPRSLARRHV